MSDHAIRGYALFDTALGRCGIAWGERGICAVQLPGLSDAAAHARLERRLAALPGSQGWPQDGPAAQPPPEVRQVMDRVRAMLSGEPQSFGDVALDMSGVPPFNQRVYAVALAIPYGQTMTYGDVARHLGEPGSARAVGQALGHNPFAPVVPCHRVLAAGARPGGFSARGGVDTKLRMLLIERASIGGPGLFDGQP